MFKPSDPYYKEFTTATPSTGAAANADSLPVATANHNGSDDGSFALTVTNLDAGRYKITGTVPSGYVKGDVVNITVAATCSTIAGKAVVDTFAIDSKRVGDLNDIAASAIVSSGAITTSSGKVAEVTLVDTLTTYTSNTPQSGDSFARIGSTGSGLTTLATAANLANLAAITSSTAFLVGVVVVGSTGAAVTVSGLPSGRSYVGQHLFHFPSGECRTIASQTFSTPNYTFAFTGAAGTEAGPFSAVTTSDSVSPVP